MSYIIQGTEYPDPPLEYLNMELEDLKSIINQKIKQYLNIEQNLLNQKQNTVNNNQENDKKILFYPEVVSDFLWFQYEGIGIISVLPLFFYFCAKTNSGTIEIELSEILQEYKDFIAQIPEDKTLQEYLQEYSNTLSFDNFLGLSAFKVQYLEMQKEFKTLTEDNSLFDWFIEYWKNNCQLINNMPNTSTNRDTDKLVLSVENQQNKTWIVGDDS